MTLFISGGVFRLIFVVRDMVVLNTSPQQPHTTENFDQLQKFVPH